MRISDWSSDVCSSDLRDQRNCQYITDIMSLYPAACLGFGHFDMVIDDFHGFAPLLVPSERGPRAGVPARGAGESCQRVCKPGSVHPLARDRRSFLKANGCPKAQAVKPDS